MTKRSSKLCIAALTKLRCVTCCIRAAFIMSECGSDILYGILLAASVFTGSSLGAVSSTGCISIGNVIGVLMTLCGDDRLMCGYGLASGALYAVCQACIFTGCIITAEYYVVQVAESINRLRLKYSLSTFCTIGSSSRTGGSTCCSNSGNRLNLMRSLSNGITAGSQLITARPVYVTGITLLLTGSSLLVLDHVSLTGMSGSVNGNNSCCGIAASLVFIGGNVCARLIHDACAGTGCRSCYCGILNIVSSLCDGFSRADLSVTDSTQNDLISVCQAGCLLDNGRSILGSMRGIGEILISVRITTRTLVNGVALSSTCRCNSIYKYSIVVTHSILIIGNVRITADTACAVRLLTGIRCISLFGTSRCCNNGSIRVRKLGKLLGISLCNRIKVLGEYYCVYNASFSCTSSRSGYLLCGLRFDNLVISIIRTDLGCGTGKVIAGPGESRSLPAVVQLAYCCTSFRKRVTARPVLVAGVTVFFAGCRLIVLCDGSCSLVICGIKDNLSGGCIIACLMLIIRSVITFLVHNTESLTGCCSLYADVDNVVASLLNNSYILCCGASRAMDGLGACREAGCLNVYGKGCLPSVSSESFVSLLCGITARALINVVTIFRTCVTNGRLICVVVTESVHSLSLGTGTYGTGVGFYTGCGTSGSCGLFTAVIAVYCILLVTTSTLIGMISIVLRGVDGVVMRLFTKLSINYQIRSNVGERYIPFCKGVVISSITCLGGICGSSCVLTTDNSDRADHITLRLKGDGICVECALVSIKGQIQSSSCCINGSLLGNDQVLSNSVFGNCCVDRCPCLIGYVSTQNCVEVSQSSLIAMIISSCYGLCGSVCRIVCTDVGVVACYPLTAIKHRSCQISFRFSIIVIVTKCCYFIVCCIIATRTGLICIPTNAFAGRNLSSMIFIIMTKLIHRYSVCAGISVAVKCSSNVVIILTIGGTFSRGALFGNLCKSSCLCLGFAAAVALTGSGYVNGKSRSIVITLSVITPIVTLRGDYPAVCGDLCGCSRIGVVLGAGITCPVFRVTGCGTGCLICSGMSQAVSGDHPAVLCNSTVTVLIAKVLTASAACPVCMVTRLGTGFGLCSRGSQAVRLNGNYPFICRILCCAFRIGIILFTTGAVPVIIVTGCSTCCFCSGCSVSRVSQLIRGFLISAGSNYVVGKCSSNVINVLTCSKTCSSLACRYVNSSCAGYGINRITTATRSGYGYVIAYSLGVQIAECIFSCPSMAEHCNSFVCGFSNEAVFTIEGSCVSSGTNRCTCCFSNNLRCDNRILCYLMTAVVVCTFLGSSIRSFAVSGIFCFSILMRTEVKFPAIFVYFMIAFSIGEILMANATSPVCDVTLSIAGRRYCVCLCQGVRRGINLVSGGYHSVTLCHGTMNYQIVATVCCTSVRYLILLDSSARSMLCLGDLLSINCSGVLSICIREDSVTTVVLTGPIFIVTFCITGCSLSICLDQLMTKRLLKCRATSGTYLRGCTGCRIAGDVIEGIEGFSSNSSRLYTVLILEYTVALATSPIFVITLYATSCCFGRGFSSIMAESIYCNIVDLVCSIFIGEITVTSVTIPILHVAGFGTGCRLCICMSQAVSGSADDPAILGYFGISLIIREILFTSIAIPICIVTRFGTGCTC